MLEHEVCELVVLQAGLTDLVVVYELFWAVLGYSGLFWAVLSCLGCSELSGLFWAVLGYSGLFWIVWEPF